MLAARSYGHGERGVVFLHGFLGSGQNLGSLARRIVTADPSIRAHAPDLLGHGDSPALPPDADLWDLARALLAWMREVGVRDVVGHSLGGRTALAAKSLDAAAVGRIVLLDIAPGPTTRLPVTGVAEALLDLPDRASSRDAFMAPLLERGLSRALAGWLLMNLERTDSGDHGWRIDREALLQMHERSQAIDLWQVVEDGADVHAVRGELSPYVSPTDVERFQSNGVAVDVVTQAAHFLHADNLDETVECVDSALA